MGEALRSSFYAFKSYRLIKKMRRNLLAGPVAIGQGVMVLNQKRVDLDWT